MRRWEVLAAVLTVLAIGGTLTAAFAYQLSREAQAPTLASPRSASSFVPRGNPEAGQQIFVSNCASCHGPNAEGAYGPDLRAASRAGAYFLYAFILDPQTVNTKATMPKLPLSEPELVDLVAYLMSLKQAP